MEEGRSLISFAKKREAYKTDGRKDDRSPCSLGRPLRLDDERQKRHGYQISITDFRSISFFWSDESLTIMDLKILTRLLIAEPVRPKYIEGRGKTVRSAHWDDRFARTIYKTYHSSITDFKSDIFFWIEGLFINWVLKTLTRLLIAEPVNPKSSPI